MAGDWSYHSVVFAGGTAEEKGIGNLTYKGKEVVGNRFDRIRTDLGEFQWAGSIRDERWSAGRVRKRADFYARAPFETGIGG